MVWSAHARRCTDPQGAVPARAERLGAAVFSALLVPPVCQRIGDGARLHGLCKPFRALAIAAL